VDVNNLATHYMNMAGLLALFLGDDSLLTCFARSLVKHFDDNFASYANQAVTDYQCIRKLLCAFRHSRATIPSCVHRQLNSRITRVSTLNLLQPISLPPLGPAQLKTEPTHPATAFDRGKPHERSGATKLGIRRGQQQEQEFDLGHHSSRYPVQELP
jgi:hypothetical protein